MPQWQELSSKVSVILNFTRQQFLKWGGLGSISLIAILWISQVSQKPPLPKPANSDEDINETSTGPSPLIIPKPSFSDWAVGDYFLIPESSVKMLNVANPPIIDDSAAVDIAEYLLPSGSVVQVIGRQKTPDDQLWVRLQVCSLALAPELQPEVEGAVPGDQGWRLEGEFLKQAEQLTEPTPAEMGTCVD